MRTSATSSSQPTRAAQRSAASRWPCRRRWILTVTRGHIVHSSAIQIFKHKTGSRKAQKASVRRAFLVSVLAECCGLTAVLRHHFLRQQCAAHRSQHRGFFHWLVGVLATHKVSLSAPPSAERDFDLVSIKGPGRHGHFLHARHFQLHQLYFLLLHVKVPEGGGVAFSQRQAAIDCLAPPHSQTAGRPDRLRLACPVHPCSRCRRLCPRQS